MDTVLSLKLKLKWGQNLLSFDALKLIMAFEFVISLDSTYAKYNNLSQSNPTQKISGDILKNIENKNEMK